MRKQILKFMCVIIAIIFSANTAVFNAAVNQSVRVVLNGELLTFDVSPQIIDGRTLVPMRVILEELGAYVQWYEPTMTVTATKGDIVIIMQINNNVMSINGEQITLDVPPKLIGDRTLAPIRAAAEGFDALVGWSDRTRTVTIVTPEYILNRTHDIGVEFGEIFGFGDCMISKIQSDARFGFEHIRLPDSIYKNSNYIINSIRSLDIYFIHDFVMDQWQNEAIFYIGLDLAFELGLYNEAHDLAPELLLLYGLGDEHIINIDIVIIDASTSAVIIELLPKNWAMTATYIGVAFNETTGLRYFLLERSFDFDNSANIPFIFSSIAIDLDDDHAYSIISIIENNRQAFISAIAAEMAR